MNFKSLKEKCLYYRNLVDYRLMPNSYTIIMLDGRAFSRCIKKKFSLPFDEKFISIMDRTAEYLCKNISGCKMAYIQSDEISLILTDFDTSTRDSFFSLRLCKLQSIIASMATGKFNQLMLEHFLKENSNDNKELSISTLLDMLNKQKLIEFDCKGWTVPTYNDMVAWLLFRQNDCIKNSKEQAAQAYFTHKELYHLTTDEQVRKLKDSYGIEWEAFTDGEKYGRFIYRENAIFHNIERDVVYKRNIWTIHPAFPLHTIEGRERFLGLNIIPVLSMDS